MALIIYPDTGYDSFCSVVDADDLIDLNIPAAQADAWFNIADDFDKEVLLRQATTIIKHRIDLPDTLEDNLKLATVYLANASIGIDMTNEDGNNDIKSKEIVGVVKTEFFGTKKDSNALPDMVTMLLAAYDVKSSSSFSFERS